MDNQEPKAFFFWGAGAFALDRVVGYLRTMDSAIYVDLVAPARTCALDPMDGESFILAWHTYMERR